MQVGDTSLPCSPSSGEHHHGLHSPPCQGHCAVLVPRLLEARWGWPAVITIPLDLRWIFESYLVWLKRWACNRMIDNKLFIFACQVLEYQPEPADQWTTLGQLETTRRNHAVFSIGSETLPCLQGSGGRYPIWFSSMFELCQKMIHSIFNSILLYPINN